MKVLSAGDFLLRAGTKEKRFGQSLYFEVPIINPR